MCAFYQSGKGHSKALAEAILRGVRAIEGSEGRILEIRGRDIYEGRFENRDFTG